MYSRELIFENIMIFILYVDSKPKNSTNTDKKKFGIFNYVDV